MNVGHRFYGSRIASTHFTSKFDNANFDVKIWMFSNLVPYVIATHSRPKAVRSGDENIEVIPSVATSNERIACFRSSALFCIYAYFVSMRSPRQANLPTNSKLSQRTLYWQRPTNVVIRIIVTDLRRIQLSSLRSSEPEFFIDHHKRYSKGFFSPNRRFFRLGYIVVNDSRAIAPHFFSSDFFPKVFFAIDFTAVFVSIAHRALWLE